MRVLFGYFPGNYQEGEADDGFALSFWEKIRIFGSRFHVVDS